MDPSARHEKASLWEEVERLRRRIIGDGDEPSQRPEDAHMQAVRILSNAQQTADRYVADAQEYSRQLTEDARRRRDELLGEARVHADRVVEEAHSQASRAAEMAAAGPVSMTNGEWRDRTSELAYLRTFSEVYRTHLRTYLEALLDNVREWERSEHSSLAAARSGPPPAAPASYPVPAAVRVLIPAAVRVLIPTPVPAPVRACASVRDLVPVGEPVPVRGPVPADGPVPVRSPVPFLGPATVADAAGRGPAPFAAAAPSCRRNTVLETERPLEWNGPLSGPARTRRKSPPEGTGRRRVAPMSNRHIWLSCAGL
jgi:cell division septum initiation protein DivIVA